MSTITKNVARRYFEELHNHRRIDLAEELFSAHLSGAVRAVAAMMQRAFPDYRITIREQIAEGDVVAIAWTLEGTHEGEWASPMGAIAPTGKPVSYTGSTMFRVVDGKVAEVLATNHDHLGLLQQMGAVPEVAARPGA